MKVIGCTGAVNNNHLPDARDIGITIREKKKMKKDVFQFWSCRARNILLSQADQRLENPQMPYIVIKKEANADMSCKSYDIILGGSE